METEAQGKREVKQFAQAHTAGRQENQAPPSMLLHHVHYMYLPRAQMGQGPLIYLFCKVPHKTFGAYKKIACITPHGGEDFK